MPVSSAQLYPTTSSTIRKSYLPPSSGSSYSSSKSSVYSASSYYPRSILYGSTYRSSSSGDDSTTTSNYRFGVSRYSSSNISTTNLSSSTSRANSISDKDYRKPPIGIGSRLRSESLTRDKTLDLTSSTKSDLTTTNSFRKQSASSLARSVATSGADIIEKYSVANYKPNCELSRSRSLSESTANKLVDTINSSSRSASRASSKERGGNSYITSSSATPIAALINNSNNSTTTATTKDYLNNTTSIQPSSLSSTSLSTSKVNANANYKSSLTNQLINNKQSLLSNNNNNALSETVAVPSNTNNNNFNTKRSISSILTATPIGVTILTNDNTPIPTSSLAADATNHQTTLNGFSLPLKVSTFENNVHRTATTATAKNHVINNNNIIAKNDINIANTTTDLNGVRNLKPTYKRADFLKCDYDLARSQLVKSAAPSAAAGVTNGVHNQTSSTIAKRETNNNCTPLAASSSKPNSTNGIVSLPSVRNPVRILPNRTSSIGRTGGKLNSPFLNGTLENINKKEIKSQLSSVQVALPIGSTTSAVAAATAVATAVAPSTPAAASTAPPLTNNMNCMQKNNELFDDIKFIDCDESDRKHSPITTATMPAATKFSSAREILKEFNEHNSSTLPSIIGRRTTDINTNKYNTITNNMKALHQFNNKQITNGTPKKASSEDLMSSTSSSSSTLSVTASSTSSINQDVHQKGKVTTNGVVKIDMQKVDETDNNRGSGSTSFSLWDRDSKTAHTPSRTSSDSDSLKKSFASSSISDKTDDSDGLCGLRNIGNTCFMNSVIQCLSHTSELTRYLRNKVDNRTTTKDQRIVSEFAKLIKEMWSPGCRTVTPSELKLAFSCKHRMYSGCAQQDAQEFLRFFLDSLHCALNVGSSGEKLDIDENLSNNKKAELTWEWYSKVENSIIKDLFVGQLKSSLKCTTCGNTSVTFDPFWDLSVPLPSPSSSRCKLETCLDLFIKEEILDGDEMPTCSKCKSRRKCTKSFTIQRFPKYLVIHLKRFSETRWSKLTNTVEFPTGERELNMAPYAANSSTSATYSLYGISNHMGSTAGGHYVALCKHPATRKWHEFNDNAVTSTNESSLVSSSAYLLFYERT